MARCCAQLAERRRSSLNFALLVAAYIVYLLTGAWIFSAIELPYERELRLELLDARRDFLGNNTCVSDARLEELLARALEANNYGVSVLRNDDSDNWNFVSSLFFSSTVLTTTGEGPGMHAGNPQKKLISLHSAAQSSFNARWKFQISKARELSRS